MIPPIAKPHKETKAEKLARKKAKHKLTKGYLVGQRKTLFKKCWKLMSEWVRRKDADWKGNVKCFTCGVVKHWKEMHAGHFIHDKLDFDERNLKPQDCSCNTYNGGELGIYAEKLIEENGLDWIKQLRKDAQLKGNDYSYEELLEIEKDLKSKLESLKV